LFVQPSDSKVATQFFLVAGAAKLASLEHSGSVDPIGDGHVILAVLNQADDAP
jgi:hypothetical protein